MIEEGNVSQKSNNKGILSPNEPGFKVQSCEAGKIKDSSIGIFENLFFAFSSLMAFHSRGRAYVGFQFTMCKIATKLFLGKRILWPFCGNQCDKVIFTPDFWIQSWTDSRTIMK